MKIGAQAEQFAIRYLQRQGLRFIAQNFQSRFGEIDVIMQDGDTLVFAEVRMRSSRTFGGAAASIDARKQRKLISTAQLYLANLTRLPPCRFDAVLLQTPVNTRNRRNDEPNHIFLDAQVVWIKNAFSA